MIIFPSTLSGPCTKASFLLPPSSEERLQRGFCEIYFRFCRSSNSHPAALSSSLPEMRLLHVKFAVVADSNPLALTKCHQFTELASLLMINMNFELTCFKESNHGNPTIFCNLKKRNAHQMLRKSNAFNNNNIPCFSSTLSAACPTT